MPRALRSAGLVLAALAVAACTTLPEFAAPKGWVIDPATLEGADLIAYRTLTRDDFRGAEPPAEFAAYTQWIGAATCAHLLTTPDTMLRVDPVRGADGAIRHRATSQRLRFVARMDRGCSWWNPRDVGLPEDYLLEHEQIHFALFELEARRLNRAVPEIEAGLDATAESPEAAGELVRRQLEARISARMQDILERSRAFDEDTSMGHRPEVQRRWWQRVHEALAETAD